MFCFKGNKWYNRISRKGVFPNKLCIKFIKEVFRKKEGHKK